MLLSYFFLYGLTVYVRLAVTGVGVTQETQMLLRPTLSDCSRLRPAKADYRRLMTAMYDLVGRH
jgi:hypothetical protein